MYTNFYIICMWIHFTAAVWPNRNKVIFFKNTFLNVFSWSDE